MSDDVREYLRAAQAAEVRGEVRAAVELLQKAAAVYRTTGRQSRALQMLRHAHRLDSTRADLLEEIRRLEWLPDVSTLSHAAADAMSDAEQLDAENEEALAVLDLSDDDTSVGDSSVPLVERGPRWAPEDAEAWCSFCCKPDREVGRLVAGASGAFICGSCAQFGQSAQAATTAKWGQAAFPSRKSSLSPFRPFVGERVRALLPLVPAFRRVLVLGPEGAGKSTLLAELAGAERVVTPPLTRDDSPRLVIDQGERLTEADVEWLLSQPELSWVIAFRAQAPAPAFTLLRDALTLPVFSSHALVEATEARLPLPLAEASELTLALPEPDAALLAEVARRLAEEAGLTYDEPLISRLADEAALSPRRGHELSALLSRVPKGDWALAPAEAKSRPRASRKKKKEEPA